MERETTGGYFWDVILLTDYNEYWEPFFMNLIRVLPCDKCVKESIHHYSLHPIPKFKNTDEKNEYVWKLREGQGGKEWRSEVFKNKYTLESWLAKFKDKPFTRINKNWV